jgi:1-acyl-sn-glycerol-3-phosphate acyltransferase
MQVTEIGQSAILTIVRSLYTAYCLILFTALAGAVILINGFVRNLRTRRRVAGAFSRAFLRVAGIRLEVENLHRLPPVPCVVVSNHASYLDGIVAIAALPPDFAFVIKKEMVRVPLAGILLRRLGSEFVERFDRHKGAIDARRVLKRATGGQSLVFFPEGTFSELRQIGKFLGGAFATAARARMPVVAMAIHGTRDALPSGTLLLRRLPLRVEVLETMPPHEARHRSREVIGKAVGEPLA